jgi:hypothetical protein
MGWFLPALVGGLASGAASAALSRRGGGGGAPPAPELDPRGKEFQTELYGGLTRALAGGELVPGLAGRTERERLAAVQKGFAETQYDLPGMLSRMVPRADVKVRQFVRKSLGAQLARTREGIREETAMQKFEDKPLAQSMAFDALAGEKRMGASITSMYNQSMLRRAQAPGFGSEFYGGLGGAAGIMLAGPVGYANMFNKLA